MTVPATRYERWRCRCGHPLDCASPVENDTDVPEPGDVTLCLHCAEIYVLEDDRQHWRPITDDELIGMSLEEKKQISAVQLRIREFNKNGQ